MGLVLVIHYYKFSGKSDNWTLAINDKPPLLPHTMISIRQLIMSCAITSYINSLLAICWDGLRTFWGTITTHKWHDTYCSVTYTLSQKKKQVTTFYTITWTTSVWLQ